MKKLIIALSVLLSILCVENIPKAAAQTVLTQTRIPFDAINNVNVGGSDNWNNPLNIRGSDNVFTNLNTVPQGTQSRRLDTFQYTFAIPEFATIRGIEVTWEGYGSTTTFTTDEVLLGWGASGVSSNLCPGACSATWPSPSTQNYMNHTKTYGGPTNLWGATGWNAARINDNTFGAYIKMRGGSDGNFFMDSVTVVVYYTPCGNIDCINGTCVGVNTCACNPGWNGTTCNSAICIPACDHGSCTSPNLCTCQTGWNGTRCTEAICNAGCVHGTCGSPNNCTCDFGWQGTNCNTPRCSPSCLHGTCMGGGTCNCTGTPYEGARCEIPVCNPRCVGGVCNSSFICNCSPGWSGTSCEIPQCSFSCGNGVCGAPDNCTCDSGWRGDRCEIPICEPQCQHNGTCTAPNTCECDPSSTYEGSYCHLPICDPPCLNGGTCIENGKTRTCQCATGWDGDNCTVPLCVKFACNQGYCSAPNFCTCNPGWQGIACDEVITPTTGVPVSLTTGEPPIITTGSTTGEEKIEESTPELWAPLSFAAFIGIIVGGCVFCVLLCVACAFLIWFKRGRYSFSPKVTETDDVPLDKKSGSDSD